MSLICTSRLHNASPVTAALPGTACSWDPTQWKAESLFLLGYAPRCHCRGEEGIRPGCNRGRNLRLETNSCLQACSRFLATIIRITSLVPAAE